MKTISEFCPKTLTEEPTPDHLVDCKDCGLYDHGTRMVWGEGNPEAPIMIILDNPGARENRGGESFLCGTRQTLQEVASDAGLKIDDLYVTFILKRKPVRAYEKEVTRQICMQHLNQQLTEKKPRLLLCLGNVAVQSFFQDPEAEVKSLRGSWHDIQGFQTAVAYHPLAVRRRPNLRSLFLEDLRFVAERYSDLTG
ncbi:uracil-DNA glycosylase [Sporosarcina sp. JAI121]|uniref:uracil-DNA glycosylase n=1 Tax=Sporosarcina sp. JAI121 TaxID=2723064 RepID=UPI0015CAE69C|nr:uracil-DNA glycosylase [Sporosarcina sp. JAI121]NYF25296.1 DNA polymerase [Sporosarcina sp. JAI121]